MRLPTRAAWRYARALVDLAGSTGELEAVHADLLALQRELAASPALAAFLPNYLIGREPRARALRALWEGRVRPLTLQLILLLEHKKRLAILGDIIACFMERYDQACGIVRGRVTSAYALEEPEVAGIAARLQPRLKRALTLQGAVNPALLGGFQVWIEDQVYDLSLAARLRAAGEAMAGGRST